MVAASAMMITAPLLAKQTIALGAILRVRFKIFLPQEGRRTRRATSSKAWHARAQAVFAERNQCGTLCGTFVRFDAVNWGFVRLRFYEFPVCRQNRNVRNALIYWAFRIALSGDPSRIRTCNPRSRNPFSCFLYQRLSRFVLLWCCGLELWSLLGHPDQSFNLYLED